MDQGQAAPENQVTPVAAETPKFFFYQLEKTRGSYIIYQNFTILLLLFIDTLTPSYADKILAQSKYFDTISSKIEKQKDVNIIYEHI